MMSNTCYFPQQSIPLKCGGSHSAIGGGAGGGGRRGSCPHLQTMGQTVLNAPHFADSVKWWLQARKNIGIIGWKCVKYYQISVKFACNYFKNSSASGDSRPRTPVVWPHPKPPSAAFAFGRPRFGPCGPQMYLGRPLLSITQSRFVVVWKTFKNILLYYVTKVYSNFS